VRIPKAYRFDCDEVYIERDGDRVILPPRPAPFKEYFDRASRFTDDFPDEIEDKPPQTPDTTFLILTKGTLAEVTLACSRKTPAN
jgi:antitoxin VapB